MWPPLDFVSIAQPSSAGSSLPPERGDWFNHQKLLEPIGNIPAAELEAMHREEQGRPAGLAGLG
jgi:hypothetical protein